MERRIVDGNYPKKKVTWVGIFLNEIIVELTQLNLL